MMYSFRIEQAIRAAAILHQDQTRKGPAPYPFVVHLFAVSCIVADYTNDEDIIISALLHDTLEDTDYTGPELQTDFGERVRSIVEGTTDTQGSTDSRSWLEKKQAFLERLSRASQESLLVVAGEQIHNMRSIVEEYQATVPKFLADFGDTVDDYVNFYSALGVLLQGQLQSDIIHEYVHVLGEYKNFVNHAE